MKFVIKKLITLIITIAVVSFLAFCAFQLIGDPAARMLGAEATPEAVAALRESMGFNRPLPVRYFEWAADFIKGDFGTSYSYKLPVANMILPKLGVTVILTLMAFVITCIASFIITIYQARKPNSLFERVITVTNQIVMTIPPFFIGILFTAVFGLALHLFTPGYYVSYKESIGGFFAYMIFPALAIALPKTAQAVKMMRGQVLEQMKSDYIRTAYGRGMDRNMALNYHALHNAAIPVISFLAVSLSEMLASCIIIEQIFSIPGIGRLLLSSIGSRDIPVVLAIVVILVLWVILVNFIADVIYPLIDPRIKVK